MRRNQSSKEWREQHLRRDSSICTKAKGGTELGGSRSLEGPYRGEREGL